jgi:hypothetical protein
MNTINADGPRGRPTRQAALVAKAKITHFIVDQKCMAMRPKKKQRK